MKLSVLFVDDDDSIINGLRRMMHPMRNKWELFYVTGGKEALDLLEKTKIDVIISDIRMPVIDGNQLLTQIKAKYPHIVRITLSGYANDSLALRNARIVHQSLSKPTTPEDVKTTIEKAYRLKQKLNNEELLSVINGIDDLPSLPEIYLKLEEEINSENSSIDKISSIISTDPMITAKILQLTNSAFFGLPNRITNIPQALNFLGIKIIQNLVLSIKLFRSIEANSPYASKYEEIWIHSNHVAFLAQRLAQLVELPKVDIEDTYLGGLLHDIGKLIILEQIEIDHSTNDFNIKKYEEQFENITHADMGAYLLGIWGLPHTIVESVAYHHVGDNFYESKITPAQIVYISNNIANRGKLTADEITEENLEEIITEYSSTAEAEE